jgi:hypothetical protein
VYPFRVSRKDQKTQLTQRVQDVCGISQGLAEREVISLLRDNRDLDRQTQLSANIDIKKISGAVANLPEPEQDDDGEFDWSDDDTIVCYEQPKSKVYFNPHGQVVIRQQVAGHRDEDSFVFFNCENVPALIAALRGCIQEDVESAPKDRTAAERQGRHRQRDSHGPCHGSYRDSHGYVTRGPA